MKTPLLFFSITVGFTLGITPAFGFKEPSRAPLANFDKRQKVEAALPAEKGAEKENLKKQVPNLKVQMDKVLGSVSFVSSHSHFLTDSKAQGAGQAKGSGSEDNYGPVKAFLNEHSALFGFGSEVLGKAKVQREFVTPHNGLRNVVWQQHLDDIPVYGGVMIGNITKDGALVNFSTHFVSDPEKAAKTGGQSRSAAINNPEISAEEAIVAATGSIKHLLSRAELKGTDNEQGPTRKKHFKASAKVKGNIEASLVWIPMDSQVMNLAWQVILTSAERGEMFLFIVDATSGEVIIRRSLTNYLSNATYNVFTSDSPSPFSPGHFFPNSTQPPLVSRTLVTLSALNTTASPNGWINDNDNETLGNNVDAHTDLDGDDVPDLPRPLGNPTRVFDFPLDLTQDPTNSSQASVVQLFYWNNFMHDKLYELGFTEAAGNFQQDNFGRGGSSGDPVIADGQDGGGFDNANMSTPADGSSPLMQMYLFTGPTPFRDGSLDAEVVCHEYTHGLSNRRVGGGVGIFEAQSRGMGEGWSDFYGLSLLSESGDNVDANYAAGGYASYLIWGPNFTQNYYYGIRRYPYSTDMSKNPLTFKDIDPLQASTHPGIPRSPIGSSGAAEEHNMGEVWCVTLWDVRAALIKKHGYAIGNTLAMRLVADGMTLSPADPNFLQARDAIVLADKVDTGGANYATLWTAFAKRGMGGSATSPDSSTSIGVVEAFDLPGLAVISVHNDDSLTGNNNGTVDPNECNYLYVNLQNGSISNATTISATLSTVTPGVTVEQAVSLYPDLVPGGVANNLTPYRIYTSPSFVCGTPIIFNLVIVSAQERRTNQFRLKTGFIAISPIVYGSSTQIQIPDADSNGVDAPLTISNFGSTIGKATVSLYLTHTFDLDLTIELVAPDGTKVGLVRNAPTDGDNFGTNCSPFSARTTFDDGAAATISSGSAPFVGTFRPADPLDVLTAVNANGTWKLHIVDSISQDTGTLQCWSLSLYPKVCSDGGGGCGADLSVDASGPAAGSTGSNLTYNVLISNTKPFIATNIVFNNVLPQGFNFVSAVSSQGDLTYTNGLVSGLLGNLNTGTIHVAITVAPTVAGTFTNLFSISAANDSNPNNNSDSVVTAVTAATPNIVGSGAQITSENVVVNGSVEPGETVTINFGLKNTGTGNTANLVATLLSSGGVTAPSGSQTYGALAAGGSAVTKPFTFTANAIAGSVITATLQLQDGANSLGTVTFTFVVTSSQTFANGNPIIINDVAPASPYPATINVSGLTGIISKVTVNLSKFAHTFPDDVDVLLVGPSGQKVVLMSDVGGEVAATNINLTFDSTLTNKIADNGPLTSGSYALTDFETGDTFVTPAPTGPYGNSLNIYNASNPNGVWSLFVVDDSLHDGGVINGGWSLSINTVVPVNTNADVAVNITGSANPAVIGANLVYTISVVNNGQNTATGIWLTNVIPAGANFVSANPTQGFSSYSAGTVTWNVGTLASGAGATLTVTVVPVTGTLVSTVQASANELDLNLFNNSVSLTTPTRSPQADLAVSGAILSSAVLVSNNVAYTVAVTNLGPDTAANVIVSNAFSGAFNYVNGTASQGSVTNSGLSVLANIGTLPSGSNAVISFVVAPANLGTFTDAVFASSAATDLVSSNSTTNIVANVIAPSPTIVSSGSALAGEFFVPANNAIEPGESITMNFALRNVGTGPTANLTATLLNTGGVVNSSGSVSYGVLAAGGSSVSRSLSFVATGTNNGTLTVTLALQDGAQSLGNIVFNYKLSSIHSVSNSSAIVIPAIGNASFYPATISVAGITGLISKVSVTVSNLTHSFPEDIDMLLVGPAGQKVLLMSDAGGGNSISNVTLQFDDSGSALPAATKINSGTYTPTDYTVGDSFSSPAPSGPYANSLSVFNLTSPNGTWSLYIVDDSGGDAGRIDGGWSLTFLVAATLTNNADLAVLASGTPDSLLSLSNVAYSITVVNTGPGVAHNVVLSELLPASFNVISNTVSQGSVVGTSNNLSFQLGNLEIGAVANLSLVATPVATGTFTNAMLVSATEPDVNLTDNSAKVVTVSMPMPASFGSYGLTTNRNFQLTFAGQPGYSYVIEGSTNLVNWVPIATNVVLNTGNLQLIDSNTSSYKFRFYRAHKQ